MTKRVIVAGGNRGWLEEIGGHLRDLDLAVQLVDSAHALMQSSVLEPVHLLILDASQSTANWDGWQVSEQVRRHSGIPLLLIVPEGAHNPRIRALRLGADDCLTWPLSWRELLARVTALLRRTEEFGLRRGHVVWVDAGLYLDLQQRTVWVKNRQLVLTVREFDVLACLARQVGQTVTYEDLQRQLWGQKGRRGLLKQYISRLRRKLEVNPKRPKWVITERRTGYRLQPNLESFT